eukprot:m.459314 g.459314  ORF g.459314 m.459314 type:complete len:247 (+) comp21717_c0_seq1:186-926(+)
MPSAAPAANNGNEVAISSSECATAVPPTIWLVRHGERADEVDGPEARAAEAACPDYDPPLTRTGLEQAQEAAKWIKATMTKRGVDSIDELLVSPLRRTMLTAAPISEVLGLPVSICPVLAESAMAVSQRHGIFIEENGGMVLRRTKEPLMTHDEIVALAGGAGGAVSDDIVTVREPEGAKKVKWPHKAASLYRRALEHKHEHVLWVTHRESFRHLLVDQRLKIPYCGVALLRRRADGTWFVDERSW